MRFYGGKGGMPTPRQIFNDVIVFDHPEGFNNGSA